MTLGEFTKGENSGWLYKVNGKLPDVGLMKMKDNETGQEIIVDTSSKQVRREHAQWWKKQKERLADTFNRSNVDAVSVRTDGDYVAALMSLFAKRN